MVSKLTPGKAWNAAKVLGSYVVSRYTGRAVQWGLPISISLEPTTSCNLRCPECPSGLRAFTRDTGMLDEKLFRKVIDQMYGHLLYLTFYFQGEPFLHRQFLDFVRYASGRGIYTATSTNAHYLDDAQARATVESGLDRLIVSIDGTTQETYEQYRIGGSLEKVLEGTRNVIRWKRKLKSRKPHVVFQYLVVRPNEHQVEEVQTLADQIGVDEVAYKTAQVYEYEKGNALIPENPRFSRYRKNDNGTWSIRNRLLNHCWKLWHSCVITWDGKVVPCCFDKDASHQLGDVGRNPFKRIWLDAPYRDFRSKVLNARSNVEICRNCTEGTSVFASA